MNVNVGENMEQEQYDTSNNNSDFIENESESKVLTAENTLGYDPEHIPADKYEQTYCNTCHKIRSANETICSICGEPTIKRLVNRAKSRKSKSLGGSSTNKTTSKTNKPTKHALVPPEDYKILQQALGSVRGIDVDTISRIIEQFRLNVNYKQNWESMIRLLTMNGIREGVAVPIVQNYFEVYRASGGPVPYPQHGSQGQMGQQQPIGYQVVYDQSHGGYYQKPVYPVVPGMPGMSSQGGQPNQNGQTGAPMFIMSPNQQQQPPNPYPQPYQQQTPVESPSQMMSTMVSSMATMDELRNRNNHQGGMDDETKQVLSLMTDLIKQSNEERVQSKEDRARHDERMHYMQEKYLDMLNGVMTKDKQRAQQSNSSKEELLDEELNRWDKINQRFGYSKQQPVTGRTGMDVVDSFRGDISESVRIIAGKIQNVPVPGQPPGVPGIIPGTSKPDYKVTRTQTERQNKVDSMMHQIDQGEEVIKAENDLVASVQKWATSKKANVPANDTNGE